MIHLQYNDSKNKTWHNCHESYLKQVVTIVRSRDGSWAVFLFIISYIFYFFLKIDTFTYLGRQ